MSLSKRSAFGPALVAIAGAIFCALNATQNLDSICITTGCEIFKDVSVFGISLWWIGTALFTTLALLNIFNFATTALLLALTAVIIDLGFLLLMIFTAPCVPCLGFAAILFLLFFMQCSILKRRSALVIPLLVVWALLFTPNVFSTVNEEIGTWAIYGKQQSDVQVFFSPSCSTCVKLVPTLSQNASANITYYPIAENDGDLEKIFLMQKAVSEGTSMYIAFNRAIRSTDDSVRLPLLTRLELHWNLFRNKSKLASIGVSRIPVLITNGVPRSLLSNKEKQETKGDVLDFTDDFSGCSEGNEEPCE
ncbi:hypothetical protein [Halodesulfovibrio marinisediminis]|uniref:Vitamin K epoxide reductase family protein n=1 Tax=Halodesulfovibrio marinisediminis DSM 17456 TaxID=1121457 RepID=A0A1N6DL57_9BACT|nr:hypothetical protein [Halodesulfovibrio marinisediminis]SIN71508.1 hypothetical protein SAMN02745161_0267 [Halodesulfovibrio marinisediminis DSM 17456]